MSKNNNIKLSVLSYIADDIIDMCTAVRVKLLKRSTAKKKTNKKIVIPSVCAAALALVTLSVFVIALLRSNIPVYRGMSLSSNNPGAVELANQPPLDIALLRNDTDPTLEFANNIDQSSIIKIDNKNNKNHKDSETTQTEEPQMHTSPGAQMFYANPNEDFYITVHIDNPKNYEIVSFTLNGKKYSSYMFEEGSDMENLILKCNVGDATGFVEYTIDAIKYIDGTTIKDVLLKGEQTVVIGVGVDAPIDISVDNIKEDFNSVSFDMSFEDPLGLLDNESSKLTANLYSNEVLKSQATIQAFDPSVKFDDIADGTAYRCEIFVVYDALDGQGEKEVALKTITLTTKARFDVTFWNKSYKSTDFSIRPQKGFEDITINSATLYKNQEKVSTVDLSKDTITGLDHNTEYILKIEYSLGSKKIIKEKTFKTMEAPTPKMYITDLVPAKTSISFKLDIDDPGNICKIEDIKLIQRDGQKTVATAKLAEKFTFTDLEILKSYQLHVKYSYDLNDGKGIQQNTFISCSMPTQSEGLEIQIDGDDINGFYVYTEGIGTCTDEVVYVNTRVVRGNFQNSNVVFLALGPDVEGVFWTTVLGSNGSLRYVFVSKESLTSDIWNPGEYYKFPSSVAIFTNAPDSYKDGMQPSNAIFNFNPTNVYKASDGMVYGTLNGKKTAFAYLGKNAKVVIEDSTEVIGNRLFNHNEYIEEIVLPNSVKRIEHSAFRNCKYLENVSFSSSLEYVGTMAFLNCEALEKIDLPSSVTFIGNSAFAGMSKLKSITIPVGITEISLGMLNNCTSLETVIIPNSVTKIGDSAFSSCKRLQNLILPQNLKHIGQSAFNGCNSLTKLSLPDGLESIGIYAFSSCYLTLRVPNSVVNVGENAFGSCTVYVPFATKNDRPSGWHKDWASYAKEVVYNVKDFITDSQGISYIIYNDGTMEAV